jgi:hypothetical protein
MKMQEQQLRTHETQLRAMRHMLDIVQHTRMYRRFRLMGRWKFMEQMLPQFPAASPTRSQSEGETLTGLSGTEREHLPPSKRQQVDISLPQHTADVHQQAEFDPYYGQVRHPKERGGVYYAPGADGRIVQRLRLLGLKVYDYE